MRIEYVKNNRCYSNAQIIKPQWIIVHSTGCGMGTTERMLKSWNKKSASTCAHGAADAHGYVCCLPLNFKGWHVGAKGNGKTIGFEICEPENIAYKSGAVIDTLLYNVHDRAVLKDFNERYNHGVMFCAELMHETGIDIDHVVSHAEAYRLGLATNHADVGHWFSLFGVTMDDFRNSVTEYYNSVYKTGETTVKSDEKSVSGIHGIADVQRFVGTTADGIYGRKTKAAIVKAVQAAIGTTPDGIFGKKSRAAWKTVSRGSNGQLVKLVQCMLICKGYSCGTSGADGIFGNNTYDEILTFQVNKSLQVDGIVGRNTAASLFS